MRLTASWRSSCDSTRGWRISTKSCSGNCASSAWTSRAAVSPVASETTCSSTGGFGIGGQRNGAWPSVPIPNPHPPRGRQITPAPLAPASKLRGRPARTARVTSAHGGDGATGDDGNDRLPLPPPRLRLPFLRDLRRPRLDVRLRPLRRPHEEQHPL